MAFLRKTLKAAEHIRSTISLGARQTMSNIFISHSSHDKPFVRNLASALLSEGFPVWLDSWQLELGDSLLDRIYSGIENSSVVLLIMSQRAIESGWVNRELNAALSQEEQAHRKFVIPIKIDGYTIPIKVADRLYADFSSSFSAPFGTLKELLVKLGCRDMSVPPDRELLVLRFTNTIHLDTATLNRSCRHIGKRHGKTVLRADQVVVNQDEEYDRLLALLHTRIDNIAADPFFSPQLESHLRWVLETIQDYERYLSEGIALLITNGCSSDAVYWLAKIIKAANAYRLWSVQMPNASDSVEYGKDWRCAELMSNFDARDFFEAKDIASIHVWTPSDRANSFYIWIDECEIENIRFKGSYFGPLGLSDVCNPSAINKYVFPQMILQHLKRGTPMVWKLDDAMIGLA